MSAACAKALWTADGDLGGRVKTLVVNNQKGGVGKTLLSVHAAWFLAEAGAKVLVVDLDAQANASYSLDGARRLGLASALFLGAPPAGAGPRAALGLSLWAGDQGLHSVDAQLIAAVHRFKQSFFAAGQGYDYCVIDTPPTWSGRNYAALMVATSLIAPIELETYALEGVKQLMSQRALVEKNARHGTPIDFLGLLPSRFQSASPRQRQNLHALLRRGSSLMFPHQGLLTQRQGYAAALDLKTPVWTLPQAAAQLAGREIRAVLTTIKHRLDQAPD
jgi:chromosome partitioning protein